MNPGPLEESAKAVVGIVESLKSQPLSLALVIMNVCLLAFLWYGIRYSYDLRNQEFKLIFEANKEIQILLSRCVVPKE